MRSWPHGLRSASPGASRTSLGWWARHSHLVVVAKILLTFALMMHLMLVVSGVLPDQRMATVTAIAGLILVIAGASLHFWNGQILRSHLQSEGKGVLLTHGGLYGRIRHPMYLGDILGVMGVFVLWPDPICFALVSLAVVVTFILARSEDLQLHHRFGREFESWHRRSGFLLPLL